MSNWKSRAGRWSPLKIPDKFRQYSQSTDPEDENPLHSWDPSDWDDPDKQGLVSRLTPSHAGQWLILGAVVTIFVGLVLWIGSFFPLFSGNPWTLVMTVGPALIMFAYVRGREDGFSKNQELEWAFLITGRSLHIIPGKFVGRFGHGDLQHIKFTPLKGRAYGAFRFDYLKLGDLSANRANLMSKATQTNRGPDSEAVIMLPGPLTGESSDTVLGRVFGVHGGDLVFNDVGTETDMRVTKPTSLDDDIAGEVLQHIHILDTRVIPELKSEIQTLDTLKNRYKHRAESERDPELDRIFGAVDKMSQLLNNPGGRARESDRRNRDVDEVTAEARNYFEENN